MFARQLALPAEHLTDLKRAVRFLYVQRLAFGGKVDGRNFGVSAGNPGSFDATKLAPVLEKIHQRLWPVIIEQLPYADFIDGTMPSRRCSTSTRLISGVRATTARASSAGPTSPRSPSSWSGAAVASSYRSTMGRRSARSSRASRSRRSRRPTRSVAALRLRRLAS